MNSTTREQLRLSLLRLLDAAAGNRFGMQVGLLRQMAIAEGFGEVTEREVAAELEYLKDKGLADWQSKPISPENRVWRITAAGRDHFAQL